MSVRVPISDELAAKVLYASDRTCCVCRLEKHKVQIHHVDEDPSNNSWDNLAVICLHCHSDAHTTGAFVRNLTPELIRLYNTSWRTLVELKLNPARDPSGQKEFQSEAYLEVSLDCHSWKVFYMALFRYDFPGSKPGSFQDVWDAMVTVWQHTYSTELYQRFLPLFDQGIRDVQRRFDRAIQLFPEALPYDFRTTLIRAHRQLNTQRVAYLNLHSWVNPGEDLSAYVNMCFAETIKVLRDVSRDADRRRDLLTATAQSAG